MHGDGFAGPDGPFLAQKKGWGVYPGHDSSGPYPCATGYFSVLREGRSKGRRTRLPGKQLTR